MNLKENIQRIKEVMGIVESKVGKPIQSKILEIPKIDGKITQNNKTLFNQIQTNFGEKINLKGIDINNRNFLTQLSDRLLNAGVEPFLYTYPDEENPSKGLSFSGGLTYYIPNTDISVSYEPGVFGVGFGNLSLSYEPESKSASAGFIIPIGN